MISNLKAQPWSTSFGFVHLERDLDNRDGEFTSGRLGGVGETPELSVLLNGLGDPVDLGVAPDGLVEGVDEDDLEVLVGRVLADPVRAKDAESLQTATNTLLRTKKKIRTC